ncbi:permease prefix domain 1-containing protein [Nonomuraea typhae]|uniref:permease prefix domain 1-containing protein n=1 Tax=Nonomuraea typhae TaxID=2603600 RepID=UPI0012FB9648|nr:permease prefix domain 1-containing protein [Nonomuraea typhae]
MLIDDYVADLGRALAGPAGPKRDMVVEARDSLIDTADAFEADGLAREEAELLAVREFGTVEEIAPGYQSELTACAGRRLGGLLFVSVPLTALAWAMIWKVFPLAPEVWASKPEWFEACSRALDLVQLGVGVAGGLALLALGRGARLLPRARAVTRTLGGLVLAMLVATMVLGWLLSVGAKGMTGFAAYPPGVLVTLATYALAGMQFYCAVRCLRITRTAVAHR